MTGQEELGRQRELIAALAASLGAPCTWHETHISWVLVCGRFAWKFKKAVRFDFLDFSSLAQRRFYCEEELRLNRRFVPGIYLDVVAVSGDPRHPVLGGAGEPLEYAVKMLAFDQDALWSRRAEQGRLTCGEIDALAENLACIHKEAACSPADSAWCTPSALDAIADETLSLIAAMLPADAGAERLREWERRQRNALRTVFLHRKEHGSIRECHGDLHCGNILTRDGVVEAFDCIEFNESLRWIDVMNDIAFTCMDLRSRGLGAFASRLLNRYVESTGDYEGLRVFPYYEVHRSLIRCKVALLRTAQEAPSAAGEAHRDALHYLSFAFGRMNRASPAIIITHGFSGSGKSTLARSAVELLDAIQLRSDVERKRLHGMQPSERGTHAIYVADVTEKVYARLHGLARTVVEAGWPVIVDATFLVRAQRRKFHALAQELGVGFLILDAAADVEEMRRRIVRRQQEGNDASDAGLAILDLQLAGHEPFSGEEMPYVVTVDAAMPTALEQLRARLAAAFT